MTAFRVAEENGRFVITFDDGRMNLLSAETLRELETILEPILGDCSGKCSSGRPSSSRGNEIPRLVVFRSGRPDLFAAGADMERMSRFSHHDAREFAALGQRVFDAISNLPVPTAVVIDGDCYGGALDLALAFDVRIATARSRFSHPGARIGIVTGFGGTVRIPRQLRKPAAARILMANDVLSAEDAQACGLIDAIAGDEVALEHPLLESLAAADAGAVLLTRLLERKAHLPAEQLDRLATRAAELYSATRK